MDNKQSKKVNEWVVSKVLDFALAGGETAPKKLQEARLDICAVCPKRILAQPHPTLPEVACCSECGCSLLTKSKYLKIPRLITNINQPLTVSEILGMLKAKAINKQDLTLVPITCPMSAWAKVDSIFS